MMYGQWLILIYSLFIIVAVRIHNEGSTPTVGMNYSLICDISGSEGVNLTSLNVKYNWTKTDNYGNQVQVEHYSRALQFSTLKLSDAGKYTCVVILDSHLQYNTTNTSMEDSFRIIIQSRCTYCMNVSDFHVYRDQNKL